MLLRSSRFPLLPRQATFLGSADTHLKSNGSPMTGSGITRLFVVGERRITLRQSALRASLHGVGGTGEESPRAAPSFRGDAKRRTRNPEIPRCAIAHLRFASSTRPGMTKRLRHAG